MNAPERCGAVLRLQDWPDAICGLRPGHPPPHDGETGTAVVRWIDREERPPAALRLVRAQCAPSCDWLTTRTHAEGCEAR